VDPRQGKQPAPLLRSAQVRRACAPVVMLRASRAEASVDICSLSLDWHHRVTSRRLK
jgi:hypothetical protein